MVNFNTSSEVAGGERKNHMLIAGTGRAGTSFLVRYLSELGLETEITRNGDGQWNEHANAGFETLSFFPSADNPPYVIKCPWYSEFIEHFLAQPTLTLDVAIIPVRDLVEAAASRVILEMRAIHDGFPQMADLDETWESWATTPGGIVFSLNPLDQARILAVGFHRLVQRLTESDVPIVFLTFPRLVTDGEYLFAKLRPFLPSHITSETAHAAHQALANFEKVRVGDEIASDIANRSSLSAISTGLKHPDQQQLDHIAIRRELKRLKVEREALARAHDDLIAERDALARTHSDLIAEHEAFARAQNDLIAERDALARTHHDLITEHEASARTQNDLITEREVLTSARDIAISERDMLLASRSWQVTSPLRRLRGIFVRKAS